jgi:hypothetical protein
MDVMGDNCLAKRKDAPASGKMGDNRQKVKGQEGNVPGGAHHPEMAALCLFSGFMA